MSSASTSDFKGATETFTPRDLYIIAQGLVCGLEKLGAVEPPYQETSNLVDMSLIAMNPIFSPWVTAVLLGGDYPIAKSWLSGDYSIAKSWLWLEGSDNE